MITTIVLIRAEPSSIPATAQFLAEIDGVTDVYSVSGDWDLVAIVKVAEYDQIAKVVTESFPLVPGLGVIVCFAMMYSLDAETWYRLIIWLAIGLAIYFGYSRHNSRMNKPL